MAHTNSGRRIRISWKLVLILLALCVMLVGAVSLADAEKATLEFISRWCPRGTTPLAGNSVHIDRMFLSRYMPKLDKWLHYRNVDVSTIKELAVRWTPGIYEGRPHKKGNHRARDDIHESLEELRYYRNTLFRTSR